MKKKFDIDCEAERIVSKICLKWREYVVDEYIKIDWTFFEDGDKEKMLADEEFFSVIWVMLYEKIEYFSDCYVCDDYFYIVRLDKHTAYQVARKLVWNAFKNTTKGTNSGEIIPYSYISVGKEKGMAISFTYEDRIRHYIHYPYEPTGEWVNYQETYEKFAGLVYWYAETCLFDGGLCITDEFIENIKKYQISLDEARKKTNFLFENECSIYV